MGKSGTGWSTVLASVGWLMLSACGDGEPAKQAAGGASGQPTKPGPNGGGGAASGGSASGTSGNASGTSGSAASATDFIAAYCGAARACCEVDGFPIEPLADCETAIKTQIALVAGLERGTVVPTAQLPACIAALEGIAPSCVVDASTFAMCAHAFAGTIDEGGACDKVVDCKRGEHPVACLKLADASKGVCRTLEPAAVDSPCLTTSDSEDDYGVTYSTSASTAPSLAYCSLSAGNYCDYTTNVCRPRLAATAPCEARPQCADGLACVQTCQAPKPRGAACTSAVECDEASLCTEGTCQAAHFASKSLCGGDLD